jgi:hypothetical protein
MTADRSELPGFLTIPEPALMFASGKLDKHPLRGLIDHGPFGLKYGTPFSLRLALLSPKANVRQMRGLISELTGGATTTSATLRLSLSKRRASSVACGQSANFPVGITLNEAAASGC